MLLIVTLQAAGAAPEAAAILPASDWITMGEDCRVFAAGDVDGDGWADFLTINGNSDLCVAQSVNGFKSAGWRGVANDLSPDAVAIAVHSGVTGPPAQSTGATESSAAAVATGATVLVIEKLQLTVLGDYAGGRFASRSVIAAPAGRSFTGAAGSVVLDDQGGRWQVTGQTLVADASAAQRVAASTPAISPPPYDPDASEVARLTSSFAPEGGLLAWTVFRTDRPYRHLVTRVSVLESPAKGDSDADGLGDDEERALGTDAGNRDTDGDGLLDGWEVHGLPRSVELGSRVGLYSAASDEQRPRQLDPRRQDVLVAVSYFPSADVESFRKQMGQVEDVYRRVTSQNPDGTKGIWIHFIELPGLVAEEDTRLAWWDVGGKYLPRQWRGMVHWMQVTGGGGGQSSETGDMGSSSHGWAAFAHELGHQLSLSHTGDSSPGLCPLYTSLMNYAYNYSFAGEGSAIHFSSGELRDVVLDERHLLERLPYPHEKVKFLANRPFRFTLEDAGDGTTLIDWNHNGVFDEDPVEADINYGYATHAGTRQTHELIGSSPSLAYVGETCLLAAGRHKHDAITVKAYLGDEKWSEPITVPGSASVHDPVLAGGTDSALLFFRRSTEWRVARLTVEQEKPVVGKPVALANLPLADLSALRVGDRWLLITRYDDDRLEARWLKMGEKPDFSEPVALKASSQVPVGLAVNPADGTITMVGGARHEKAGPFTMQLVSLMIEDEAIRESPPTYTHNGRGNHCTSRPVVVYRGEGSWAQLAVFHTGWPAENGTWTGYRTIQVKNSSLSGGWLTNQMYDEWTRSRVAAAFADGPQGAIYAFRWDPGDHGEWKINTMFVAHEGWGIDDRPMRDFDDAAKISKWGIRHSILTLQP